MLEMAIERVRLLPPEKQDQAARALQDVVEDAEEDIYFLSDEENAAIEEGLAQLERGEFVTLEELREKLAKYGA